MRQPCAQMVSEIHKHVQASLMYSEHTYRTTTSNVPVAMRELVSERPTGCDLRPPVENHQFT